MLTLSLLNLSFCFLKLLSQLRLKKLSLQNALLHFLLLTTLLLKVLSDLLSSFLCSLLSKFPQNPLFFFYTSLISCLLNSCQLLCSPFSLLCFKLSSSKNFFCGLLFCKRIRLCIFGLFSKRISFCLCSQFSKRISLCLFGLFSKRIRLSLCSLFSKLLCLVIFLEPSYHALQFVWTLGKKLLLDLV